MSLVFQEDFENGFSVPSSNWTGGNTFGIDLIGIPYYGGFILPYQGNFSLGNKLWTGYIYHTYATGFNEWIIGLAHIAVAGWGGVNQAGWSGEWISITTGGTRHCMLAWDTENAGGKLGLYDNSKNLLWQESTGVALNKWYYMEFQIKIDASAGYIIARRDKVQIGSATGLNTKNAGASANADTIRYDTIYGGSAFDAMYNLKLDGQGDTTFLGDSLLYNKGRKESARRRIYLPYKNEDLDETLKRLEA
jgi:hypothetical protein